MNYHKQTQKDKMVGYMQRCHKFVNYSTELWEQYYIKDSLIYKLK